VAFQEANRSMIESGDVIRIGSRVRVQDGDGTEQFRIVEPDDADATADRVSAESPLARALLGRRVGEQVRFRAPGGVLSVTVVEVAG
jgi:transcription elongation GreA/GreB family factor